MRAQGTTAFLQSVVVVSGHPKDWPYLKWPTTPITYSPAFLSLQTLGKVVICFSEASKAPSN